jgi:hypothetical protein
MSLLTIAQAVARNTAIAVPSAAAGSTDRDMVNIVQFSIDTANELARRVSWGALRNTATITGTGANANFALPAGFSRLIDGNAVLIGGVAIRGGLSPDEWASLAPVEGVPRFFRLVGKTISFWPYPVLDASISVSYQSEFWCSNGSAAWSADDETALIPEDAIAKGTIWRQRRHIGQDFADYMAEYEAAMADYATFDERARSP